LPHETSYSNAVAGVDLGFVYECQRNNAQRWGARGALPDSQAALPGKCANCTQSSAAGKLFRAGATPTVDEVAAVFSMNDDRIVYRKTAQSDFFKASSAQSSVDGSLRDFRACPVP
jgi:hypothetical protein